MIVAEPKLYKSDSDRKAKPFESIDVNLFPRVWGHSILA
jgi:hypothetical protein